MYFLMGFSASLIALQWQAALLPSTVLLLSLFSSTSLLLYASSKSNAYKQWLFLLSGLLMGLSYSNFYAHHALSSVLPSHLQQQDLELLVTVEELAATRSGFQRSTAKVIAAEKTGIERVQLDWYNKEEIQVCEIWRVTARLKRPHGLRNPGTWSYRQYALEHHIHGKGYVREAEKVGKQRFCWQGFRQAWQQYVLSQLDTAQAAWVLALSTGEKALLSAEQYQFLQAFGINHLFVISGLHIGLSATAVYSVLLIFRRLGLGLLLVGDWRAPASILAMLAAIAYSAVANFGIPAQRALIMLLAFFGSGMLGVRLSVWFRYFLAMAMVLLLNPFSAMNVGFALSFGAVGILIVVAGQWRKHKPLAKLGLLVKSQFAITLGLSPLLLVYFAHVSLLSPLVNLIAIPYVSFLVVPPILMAMLLWAISSSDLGLLNLASQILDFFLTSLAKLQQMLAGFVEMQIELELSSAIILLWAWLCFLLLFWRYFAGRYLAMILPVLALFLLPKPYSLKEGELHIAFIDVGQGLSVLLRTQNHALLYDTGGSWPGGSMAKQVVLPVLSYFGVKHLHKLMISHFDNDHAGGWPDVERQTQVDQWLAPSQQAPFHFCQQGMSWYWDKVQFQVLSPEPNFVGSDNDGSCVLLIVTASGKTVLLTGDIGKQQEIKLVQEENLPSIDVLQVAHHGSKTSSSYALLEKMRQDGSFAIYSTGYLNRYGHPHQEVQKRYQDYAIATFNTALDGLVDIHIDLRGNVKANTFREQRPRYWDDVEVNHLEY